MEQITYFEKPTQVKFYDSDNDMWHGGIGIDDYIICGCCGCIESLEEIYEFATIEEPIRVYSTWVDISDEIRGI